MSSTYRDEFLKDYVVEGGRIRSPGKFEGEMVYVPYFWDKVLEGWADEEDEDGGAVFIVTPDDRKLFPELGSKKVVRVVEDSNGFVRETAR